MDIKKFLHAQNCQSWQFVTHLLFLLRPTWFWGEEGWAVGWLVGWLVGGPVDDAQETVMGRVAPLSDSQNCSLSVAWLGPLNHRRWWGGGGRVWSMLREAASFQVGGWQEGVRPSMQDSPPIQLPSTNPPPLFLSFYWIFVCHIGLFLFSSFSELVLVTRARTPFVWIWIPDKAPTGCQS